MENQRIILENAEDLMKIPFYKLIEINKQNTKIKFEGKYYEKILKEVMFFENKSIKKINIHQKTNPPKIEIVKFLVKCHTNFGENLKLTGSSIIIGNWSNFINLLYSNELDGYWEYILPSNSIENSFEYKYVKGFLNGSVDWESNKNRKFCLDQIQGLIDQKFYLLSEEPQSKLNDIDKNFIQINSNHSTSNKMKFNLDGSEQYEFDINTKELKILSIFNY